MLGQKIHRSMPERISLDVVGQVYGERREQKTQDGDLNGAHEASGSIKH